MKRFEELNSISVCSHIVRGGGYNPLNQSVTYFLPGGPLEIAGFFFARIDYLNAGR